MKKSMKKVISCIMCAALAVSMTACSGSKTAESGSSGAEVTGDAKAEEGAGASATGVDRATEFVTVATGDVYKRQRRS